MLLFIHTKQDTTPHIYRDRCQSVFLPPQSPPPKFHDSDSNLGSIRSVSSR